KEGGLGVVNGLAVHAQPLAYLVQTLHLGSRDDTFGIGPNVKQVVAALAGDIDEIAEQGLGRLEIGVVRLVTPGIVHGHAGFPIAARVTLGRDVLLRCVSVALVGSSEAIVPDQIGVLIEKRDNLGRALGRHI